MHVYFLGTGAGVPAKQRNVQSIALTLYQERGSFWLFDCGEATQHQVLSAPLKLSKWEKLFVTHLHGDHIFGIPGMLSSRSMQSESKPLTIYGPPGIDDFVKTALKISQTHLTYPIDIVEVEPGLAFYDGYLRVTAARLDHAVESFGYRIEEMPKTGALRVDLLKAAGVPKGPLYGQLKRGETVKLPDGRLIQPDSVMDPHVPGRVVTILGDTRPCPAAVTLAAKANLLVHEATFADSEQELAQKYGHSTSTQAARIAREAGVKQLVLTHISSRYQGQSAAQLLEEARVVFQNTELAEDFFEVEVPS